jgi:hypothetical protein
MRDFDQRPFWAFTIGLPILPKRSAALPKKRRNAPLLNELDEYNHETSAVVILSASPTNDDVTVIVPASIEAMPIAIVAAATNMTSCNVDWKHAGREFGARIGCEFSEKAASLSSAGGKTAAVGCVFVGDVGEVISKDAKEVRNG